MKRKQIGFLVVEYAEEFEQPLGLSLGEGLPQGGVLVWTDGARCVFSSRAEARRAIERTDHYRLAFGDTNLPEKKYCKIYPLEAGI